MRWALPVVFLAVLSGHFFYATRGASVAKAGGVWAAYDFDVPPQSRLARYVEAGDYWLGFSYGMAGAFATFCLYRAIRMRRESLAASAGGLALSGLLWASFCFLTGCCGSPMLPIYLGLLGPKFLGVTKPLTFGLTLLSIGIGCVVMLRRGRKSCGNALKETDVHAGLHEDVGARPGQV